ncbi:MAG TPA: 3',5'-cyclic-AMP phosphodiesterase [Gammaproteobacteria bacterium]|nr:3',5'-cyclic-AMP phosphodiesterase [Gammaproteobacteria bacterium]
MSESADASPLRVLQLTDTHLYADPAGTLYDCNTEDSLRRVLEAVRAQEHAPDLVLLTGDLTHDGSVQAYSRLAGLLDDAFTAPVWCLPGNHDEAAVLRQTLAGEGVVGVPEGTIADWQLVLLDSTLPASEGGHLADAELERLDSALQSHRASHALVCLHHNPVPMGSRWLDTMTVDNAPALFAVLDRHPRVRALLWGHVHQPFDGTRNGVRLLASPSTCVQFLPGSESFALDSRPPGYRWLLLHPDGAVETSVHYVNGRPSASEA